MARTVSNAVSSETAVPVESAEVERAVFDPTMLDEFRALQRPGAPSLVERTVRAFLESAPALLAELSSGLAAGDRSLIRRAAHTMKSSSGFVGLVQVNAMAGTVEEMAGGDAGLDAIAHQAVLLTAAFERGKPYLERFEASESTRAMTAV